MARIRRVLFDNVLTIELPTKNRDRSRSLLDLIIHIHIYIIHIYMYVSIYVWHIKFTFVIKNYYRNMKGLKSLGISQHIQKHDIMFSDHNITRLPTEIQK